MYMYTVHIYLFEAFYHLLALREVPNQQLQSLGRQRGVVHHHHLNEDSQELPPAVNTQVHVHVNANACTCTRTSALDTHTMYTLYMYLTCIYM